jgi:hypothetical protein
MTHFRHDSFSTQLRIITNRGKINFESTSRFIVFHSHFFGLPFGIMRRFISEYLKLFESFSEKNRYENWIEIVTEFIIEFRFIFIK